MRRYWLALTDPRLKAAMHALERAGAALGDLAAAPAGAAAFFAPLKKSLAKAAGARPGNPAGSAALAAAEDLTLRLERAFSDMARLEAPPDAAARHALLALQRACALTPRLVSRSSRAAAFAQAAALCNTGHKTLALARAAADRAPGEFPLNLKFSSIYSGLDAVFCAFERCAEALIAS
ncbi:MAG: hypothetical protein A2X35_02735 [Elusimicrobia bacterium GWA2_61_42]|nr:MAG: hypothetical protein A2X35_02735 [Elusimicrobia bacterium GWA2_61_42]OGR78067.1 MAG: hypothetical protein A2X38_01770 [Elusimicrobia bacterium GWC2_61_25]